MKNPHILFSKIEMIKISKPKRKIVFKISIKDDHYTYSTFLTDILNELYQTFQSISIEEKLHFYPFGTKIEDLKVVTFGIFSKFIIIFSVLISLLFLFVGF